MSIRLGTKKIYTNTYWKSLDLSNHASLDWQVAVDIFRDRIEGRFLTQVDALQNNSSKTIQLSCGFTIMAIDCLLIETLLQFYKGINETNDQYRRKNARAFSHFFLNSSFFSKHFNSHEKAGIFYNHVRCGILHQAQTKGKTTLNITSKKMIEWVNPANTKDGIKINRKTFHAALVKEYNSYCTMLRDPTSKILRKKFKAKMDFIATI